MSPRAAARLEQMGFTEVYEYVRGKSDWGASGLPDEGEHADAPTSGSAARKDPPTCAIDERAGDVAARMGNDGVCVVIGEGRVVLGRLRAEDARAEPDRRVEEVMEGGPTTFRANIPLEPLVERMQQRRVGNVIVTDPDGRLLGVLYRNEAEAVLDSKAA